MTREAAESCLLTLGGFRVLSWDHAADAEPNGYRRHEVRSSRLDNISVWTVHSSLTSHPVSRVSLGELYNHCRYHRWILGSGNHRQHVRSQPYSGSGSADQKRRNENQDATQCKLWQAIMLVPPDWDAVRQFIVVVCLSLAITIPIAALILNDWNKK